MDGLQREFKAVSGSSGDTVVNLVVAAGYLSRLIGNPRVSGYLESHHPEILPNSEPLSRPRRWRKAGPAHRKRRLS